MGVGGLGAALGKGSKASGGEREAEAGRQAASRLYIPAVLIYHVTDPVDSQPRRRGREGRGGLGEGCGTPIVLGPCGPFLVGCGGSVPAAPSPKGAGCVLPRLPLECGPLSLKATLVEDFQHRRSAHFFLSLAALGLSHGHGECGFGNGGLRAVRCLSSPWPWVGLGRWEAQRQCGLKTRMGGTTDLPSLLCDLGHTREPL